MVRKPIPISNSPFNLIMKMTHAKCLASIISYDEQQQKVQTSTEYVFFPFYSFLKLASLGWCIGTTQRDGMGREEGGGFRMGNTCIPVVDSF